jgi:hypothetical protein
MPLEFVRQAVHRMGLRARLCRPIRAQDQQPRWFTPPRQHCQQVQRGVIAPVQVFHYQHQRRLLSEKLQRLGAFPQHALRGCPQQPPL